MAASGLPFPPWGEGEGRERGAEGPEGEGVGVSLRTGQYVRILGVVARLGG